jgi:hypothetical protein
VTRHNSIWRDPLTAVTAQRTPTSFGLISLRLHAFPFVGVLAFRPAKMPAIIRRPVFVDKSLSAAFTSANSWHLKKASKIKRIKSGEYVAGWEEGHPSPRPLIPL